MRLTYANVVATLALFLVLAGGGAIAATKLGKNSVKAKQIAPGAVGTSEVDDGALGADDLEAGLLAGQRGPQGERGAQGEPGPEGPPGPPGVSVLARMRDAGSASSPSGAGEAAVSVTGNSWTQGATELDEILGQVTVTPPASPCAAVGGVGETGLYRVFLKLGGTTIASAEGRAGQPPETVPLLDKGARPLLFEPGAATSRTLTATITDTCTNTSTATLTKLEVDVVGVG